MKMRRLRDLEVSAIGMGCMGFTHGYGDIPAERTAFVQYIKPLSLAAISLTRRKCILISRMKNL